MSNETGSPDPNDVVVALIEGGLLKLPPKIEQLFKPYRQVSVLSKGMRVESGLIVADLSFANAERKIPAKVVLLPVQVIDGQTSDFSHYQSALRLIRRLNGMGDDT